MIDKNKPVLSVGVVADLIGVCERTLRLWEEKGLITPQRNEKNGRRMYSAIDIERLEFIKRLMNDQGLNIHGVKKMLKFYDNCCSKKCSNLKTCDNLWDEGAQ